MQQPPLYSLSCGPIPPAAAAHQRAYTWEEHTPAAIHIMFECSVSSQLESAARIPTALAPAVDASQGGVVGAVVVVVELVLTVVAEEEGVSKSRP